MLHKSVVVVVLHMCCTLRKTHVDELGLSMLGSDTEDCKAVTDLLLD